MCLAWVRSAAAVPSPVSLPCASRQSLRRLQQRHIPSLIQARRVPVPGLISFLNLLLSSPPLLSLLSSARPQGLGLLHERHVSFLIRGLQHLPAGYASLDARWGCRMHRVACVASHGMCLCAAATHLCYLCCCTKQACVPQHRQAMKVKKSVSFPFFFFSSCSRPWLCFWILHSLALLGEPLDMDLAERCIDTLSRCRVRLASRSCLTLQSFPLEFKQLLG